MLRRFDLRDGIHLYGWNVHRVWRGRQDLLRHHVRFDVGVRPHRSVRCLRRGQSGVLQRPVHSGWRGVRSR